MDIDVGDWEDTCCCTTTMMIANTERVVERLSPWMTLLAMAIDCWMAMTNAAHLFFVTFASVVSVAVPSLRSPPFPNAVFRLGLRKNRLLFFLLNPVAAIVGFVLCASLRTAAAFFDRHSMPVDSDTILSESPSATRSLLRHIELPWIPVDEFLRRH
jgi:hypothetical protein